MAKTRKKSKVTQVISLWMLLLQLISSVLLGIVFMKLDLFPVLYQIIMVIVLFIMLAIPLALQKNAFTRVCAILFSLIISAVFVMGSFYLWKTHKMLDDITVEDTETTLEDVTIVVLAEDAAQSINDTKEYTYGIQKVIDRENTDVTLQSIEAHLKSDIDVKEYESLLTQVEALYSKEVGAIILNEKFRTLIVEEYEDFDTETRVLSSYRYETPEININKNNNKLPEDGAFCVFLSGIDTFGEISTVSRSDVNIIAVVNPKSKQVLLLTTPRDYYVELPLFEGCMDKLTHAGVYGIETSMETLENLYDIEIQNYARINFTGFQTMVDALGGVEVYCEIPFTGRGHTFTEGYNHVDGEAALAFVRERYSFAAGDRQRGRNQMEMIKAIVKKIISPSILTNYASFMSSISSFVSTDMSVEMLTDLVKMQLDDGAEWNFVSYNVSGSDDHLTTYSLGNVKSYVMIPDENTINTAKELIRQVYEGEILEPVK